MKASIIIKQWHHICCLCLLLMLYSSCLSPDKPEPETNDTTSHPVTISQPVYTPTQTYSTSTRSLDNDDDEEEDDKQSETISDGRFNTPIKIT